jgi:hypothetical protein
VSCLACRHMTSCAARANRVVMCYSLGEIIWKYLLSGFSSLVLPSAALLGLVRLALNPCGLGGFGWV